MTLSGPENSVSPELLYQFIWGIVTLCERGQLLSAGRVVSALQVLLLVGHACRLLTACALCQEKMVAEAKGLAHRADISFLTRVFYLFADGHFSARGPR